MNWFLLALVRPLLYAVVNTANKILISRKISPLTYQIAYYAAGIPALLAIPLLLPIKTDTTIISILAVFGVLEAIVSYMWYYSMKNEEASRVVSLVYTLPVFTAILSAIFLGEALALHVYAGIGLLTISALAASYRHSESRKKNRNGRVSKVLPIMIVRNIIWGGYLVYTKSIIGVFEPASVIFWTLGSGTAALLAMLLVPSILQTFRREMHGTPHSWTAVVVLMSTLEVIIAFATYEAFKLASASVVISISAIQPIILIFVLVGFTRFFPHLLKEEFDRRTLALKAAAAVLIFAGTWLVMG
ncbi:EamA family transporter [Candidatus Micrarchaeota archaeon]|nr:EamA family transporter [Candidatus Micrarchaeota archaeon]